MENANILWEIASENSKRIVERPARAPPQTERHARAANLSHGPTCIFWADLSSYC
jgi:hypothetical protein